MEETYVRLVCPECEKRWQDSPGELPAPETRFACPGCGTGRRLSEFARTEHDLRTMQEF
jgi:predicted RNA-binding Zn-ribbon protein involved in translation (DUF1610 family)